MTEQTYLYNGEIVLEFNPANHQYRVINKGKSYKCPSVTRITSIIDKSAPLMAWAINNTLDVCKGAIAPGCEYAEIYLEEVWNAAKRASQRIKGDAAKRGTEIHKFIESYYRRSDGIRETDSIPIENSQPENAVISFLQELLCEVFEVERRIYSRRHRYSGTLDALGKIPEVGLVLLDWKTGKHVYPEFRLQTAAYVLAWEEEHPDQLIQGRYIVRIAEDGSIEPHFYPRSTLRKDISAFLGAKRLFDRVQEIEKEAKSLKTKQ